MRARTSSRPVAIMAAKRTRLSGELCSSLPTLPEIKGLSDVKFDNPNWDPQSLAIRMTLLRITSNSAPCRPRLAHW